MLHIRKTFGTALVAAGLTLATQAGAHGVVSQTMTLPVIGSGDSYEATITCPHGHYAIAGGF